jgi:hypothetical protein
MSQAVSGGEFVDAVLGLSMTPTSVGMVLVNGSDPDGPENSAFRLDEEDIHTSAQATAAVLRTEAMAATRGVRLHSIGVTWSEDSDVEASQLIKSLSESGFDNVVAIRLPEATEALARGIADVIGYETTAVCVIEPDVVIMLIVHTRDGAIQTAVNHAINSDESLVGWLSAVFTRADWQPEALVVVGSAGGFESVLPRLESALSVPTFAPEDAQLALARGAALASAQNIDFSFVDFADDSTSDDRPRQRDGRLAHTGALALLIGGVVTFVVSASIAVTLQLSPHKDAGSADPASAAVPSSEPSFPSPSAVVPALRAIAPPPEAPPSIEAPPPPPPEAPVVEEVLPDTPAPESPPTVDEVPAAVPQTPPAAPPVADPAAVPPAPDAVTPVPAAPTTKPPLHTRILDRLHGLGG